MAIVLQLVRMALGGFGPTTCRGLAGTGRGHAVQDVQLVAVSVFCLCGLGMLVARRVREGRPLRRSLALLTDAFALGLVMIPPCSSPPRSAVRWWRRSGGSHFSPRACPGRVPDRAAQTPGSLLRSAISSSSCGEDPGPADVRDALARALRDPSLTLAYWLPEFESLADLDGRPVKLPERGCRESDDADRPRRRACGGAGPRPRAGR